MVNLSEPAILFHEEIKKTVRRDVLIITILMHWSLLEHASVMGNDIVSEKGLRLRS